MNESTKDIFNYSYYDKETCSFIQYCYFRALHLSELTSLAGQFINKTYQFERYVLSLSFKFLQTRAYNFQSDYFSGFWSTVPSK